LGVDHYLLGKKVKQNIEALKKDVPARHLLGQESDCIKDSEENSFIWPQTDPILDPFLKLAQRSMTDALKKSLEELGYRDKTISQAGFLSGSLAQYNDFPEDFKKDLNQFRNENKILLTRNAFFIFPHFNQINELWSLTITPIFKGQVKLESPNRYANEDLRKSYKLKDSEAVMDGLETISSKEEEIFITEGIKDADRIRMWGKKAISTLGGLSRAQAGIIEGFGAKRIVIAFDADDAGRGKTKTAIGYFEESFVGVLNLPEGKDPNDLKQEELRTCEIISPSEWARLNNISLSEDQFTKPTEIENSKNPNPPIFSEPGVLTSDCYPQEGFIPLYLEYARPLTEARDQFHLATALSVLSIAYGRRIFISESSPIYSNLYLAIVGYSGGSKKSTSIRIGLKLLEDIFPERTSLANAFTPEGLQSAFGEFPTQLIEIDELGGFLGQVTKKTFMSGIIDILNSLYDCPPRFRKRRAEKTLEFYDPYPVVICSSPFRWLADETNSTLKEGGFMARFQWFISLDRLKKEDLKPITPAPNESLKNKLLQKLEDIRSMEEEDQDERYTYEDHAEKLYCQFYEEQKLSLQNEHSEQIGPHVERLLTAVKKYALIFQATKKEGVVITSQTMKEAINLCRWLRGNIEHLFQDHFHESRIDEFCHKTLKALKQMYEGEKRFFSLREITQNVRGLDSKNKTDIIETLMDRGLIDTKSGSKKSGYKENYRGWKFRPAE
jgi:hypothetical protein